MALWCSVVIMSHLSHFEVLLGMDMYHLLIKNVLNRRTYFVLRGTGHLAKATMTAEVTEVLAFFSRLLHSAVSPLLKKFQKLKVMQNVH